MGRSKKITICRHYQQLTANTVKCSFCEKLYKKADLSKMTRHLMLCFKCPQTVKNQIKEANKNLKSELDVTYESPCSPINVERETNQSSNNMNELKEMFSKALLITGTHLSMVEHPLWVNFFEKLNFQMPSRKTISTTYLDKIYKEMLKNIREDLKASNFLHLQCDGWTYICNEVIVNFVISKPDPVFINSLNTHENPHASEYLSSEIEKVLLSYGVDKFVVLIGDNARNLQKSFEIIKHKYSHIVPLNCAAHTLNLLCYDILKSELEVFISPATDVIKSIKKSQTLSALFNKIRKEKNCTQGLKLPCKTRWATHAKSLKSLILNKAALQSLAVNETLQPTADIKAILLNEDFWASVEQSISILEPIIDGIFKLEGNQFNIHEVFMILRNIKSKIEFILPSVTILDYRNKEYIKNSIEKRTKQCMKPIHYATYLLDPKSVGIELNQAQDADAMEFIYDLATYCNVDCLTDLAQYKGREGLWSKSFVWQAAKQISPVLWWKGICGSSPLSKIALRLLTAPCTLAATEETFSTQAFIHSAKRNCLTAERVAKMTFLAYNGNLLNREETINVPNEEPSSDSPNLDIENEDMMCPETISFESSVMKDRQPDDEPVASTSHGPSNIEYILKPL